MPTTTRLTVSQAVVRFLTRQFVQHDGERELFFAGCWGIFGHGNVAGFAEALQEHPELPYYQSRNEQAMGHTATAYARALFRRRAMICTTSVGPGATNMVTAAAQATVNRLPVLLVLGDTFARRNVTPVLQQVESTTTQDVSANDTLRPVSRYWDRIQRPEQLVAVLPEIMRVLTSPAETGTVTLCLPEDVQAEAYAFPTELFESRTWTVPRNRADEELLRRATVAIATAARPVIVAGGGVLYSEATEQLRAFSDAHGIPVVETLAGKGAMPGKHPLNAGGVGVTGVPSANALCGAADVVIGVGTRYSDLITASRTVFQHPTVRFVNINVTEFDAHKLAALPLTGDARVTLEALSAGLGSWTTSDSYREQIASAIASWRTERERLIGLDDAELPIQSALIGAVNDEAAGDGVLVAAAGSMPAEMHKLWDAAFPGSFHMEYGYSTMGYEISGGIGVKLARPDLRVFVMVGDGTYLMMPGDVSVAVQENLDIVFIIVVNDAFGSILHISRKLGSEGFGTQFRMRTPSGLDGPRVPVDIAANVRSLGAAVAEVRSLAEFREALRRSTGVPGVSAIVVHADPDTVVPGYAWWEVPVAEVSTISTVREARSAYERQAVRQRVPRAHV